MTAKRLTIEESASVQTDWIHAADGEVVMLTGASAGVGRATARALAKRGATIGLLARGSAGLEATRREVEDLGGRALALEADVSDPERIEEAAATVEKRFGPIDLWINNAMVSVFSPAVKMTPEEFRRVTEVTYLGAVNGTLAALRRMVPRDRGTIVQVGSALAYRSIPLQSAYCGAKHALQGFTESVRCELLHDRSRVRITMVHLPALNTPQFGWVKSRLPRKAQPVPPIFQPEVAARAILWAAHHDRRELSVGGPTVLAIVSNHFVPSYLDRHLARTGYEAQQTGEAEDPGRPHNLWHPVPGDHGAHGAFDDRAHDFSLQLWLSQRLRAILVAVLVVGLVALAFAAGRASS